MSTTLSRRYFGITLNYYRGTPLRSPHWRTMDVCLMLLKTKRTSETGSTSQSLCTRTQTLQSRVQMVNYFLLRKRYQSGRKGCENSYRKPTHVTLQDQTWSDAVIEGMYRRLSPNISNHLQQTPSDRTFPYDWKSVNVSEIFKKGQRYAPANYRPMSLTSLCCKLLEHIIVSNVLKHAGANKILTDCQHWFRSRTCIESLLVTLLHDVASALDKGTQIDMVFHR